MLRKLAEFSLIFGLSVGLIAACGKEEPKKSAKKKPKKVKRKSRKKAAKTDKKGEKKPADNADKGADEKADDKKAGDDKAAKNSAPDRPANKAAGEGDAPKVAAGEADKPAKDAPAAPGADEKTAEKEAEVAAAAPQPAGDGPVAPPPLGAAAEAPTAPDAPEKAAQPAAPAATPTPAGGEPTPPATGVLPKVAPKVGAPPPVILDKPIKRPDPPLDITGYLSAADLERVIGKKQKFRRADLPGAKPTKTYNALYYASTNNSRFGVSVQVWRDKNLVDSRTRFNTMRNTYTEVVATNRVTEQGFRAYFAGVVSLVFADPRKPVVASVSCSVKICSPEQIIELSRRVAERLR